MHRFFEISTLWGLGGGAAGRQVSRECAHGYLDDLDELSTVLSEAATAVLRELDEVGEAGGRLALNGSSSRTTTLDVLTEALRDLSRDEPALFGERMEELAYLANVLVAAHERDGARLRPKEAADAAIATVCYGAVLEIRTRQPKRKMPPTSADFVEVLRRRGMDLLFRVASSAIAAGAVPRLKTAKKAGLLYSAEELEAAIR